MGGCGETWGASIMGMRGGQGGTFFPRPRSPEAAPAPPPGAGCSDFKRMVIPRFQRHTPCHYEPCNGAECARPHGNGQYEAASIMCHAARGGLQVNNYAVCLPLLGGGSLCLGGLCLCCVHRGGMRQNARKRATRGRQHHGPLQRAAGAPATGPPRRHVPLSPAPWQLAPWQLVPWRRRG